MMTSAGDIYKELSEKYKLSVEEIRDIVTFFWGTGVKRSMEALESHEIYINKLGSFKIKGYKIPYLLSKLEVHLATLEDPIRLEHNKDLQQKLIKVQTQLEQIKQDKETFDELNKQTPRDIQEPPSDLGGVEEQSN